MNFPLFIAFFLAAFCFESGFTQVKCVDVTKDSGTITDEAKVYRFRKVEKCWLIKVPSQKEVVIKVTALTVNVERDSEVRLTVGPRTVNAKDFEAFERVQTTDTKVTFYVENIRYPYPINATFQLTYSINSFKCDEPDAFKCTETECIDKSKVCDGKKDCSNGKDEENCVTTTSSPGVDTECTKIKGLTESRSKTLKMLDDMKSVRTNDWGKETPKALTALYLANNQKPDRTDRLSLELQYIKNKEEIKVSIPDLSTYIISIVAISGNPSRFSGENVLKNLRTKLGDNEETSKKISSVEFDDVKTDSNPTNEELSNEEPDKGIAYLAKCVSGIELKPDEVKEMEVLLEQMSKQDLDDIYYNAMGMACASTQSEKIDVSILNEVAEAILDHQKGDGSFNNDVKTTALYVQILMASNNSDHHDFDFEKAVTYLMKKMESSKQDLETIAFTLPILNCKTMVDVRHNRRGKKGTALNENKSGTTLTLRYGDDEILSRNMEAKHNMSALEFLDFVDMQEPLMRFRYSEEKLKIQELFGIADDPTTGYSWQIYYTKNDPNVDTNGVKEEDEYVETKMKEGLADFTMTNVKELILWYKM